MKLAPNLCTGQLTVRIE
jgi:hypothetical protein